jgi:hypothetical protein
MSFEIARMIVQSYRQSNEQRIKNSMEMAYQEALTAYKSESAARDAALDVLKLEEKGLAAFVKDMRVARREARRGNRDLAIKQAEIAVKRANLMADFEFRLEKERIRQLQAEEDRKERRDRNRLRAAEVSAAIDKTRGLDVATAEDWANKRVRTSDIYDDQLGSAVASLANKSLEKGVTKGQINDEIKVTLDKALSQYLKVAKKNPAGIDRTSEELMPFRKADTGHKILADLNDLTQGKAPEWFENKVKAYLYGGTEDETLGFTKQAGKLGDVKTIREEDVDKVYIEQRDKYLKAKGKSTRGVSTPYTAKDIPRPVKKPVLPELPETRDVEEDRRLRQLAQPVFEALRNDFEITAEEQETLDPEAIAAYNKLKEVIIDNPLAVTQEEQLLLDDLALKRQYNIEQQTRKIQSMQPQLASPEVIQARAADIAEPSGKVDASKFTPAQQRYFATERKAYQLSDKTDNEIRNIGIPEKFGLSLFNETFDKGTQSYVPGQSFDTVLARLAVEFEGKPEEGLRALTAYNSRAMALQRASNPLIIDGKQNPDYLAALKELGK